MPRSTFTPIIGVNAGTGGTTMPGFGSSLIPEIPRNFIPKPEDRYVSFILEVNKDFTVTDIQKLKANLNRVFSGVLSGYFPELLFAKADIWDIQTNWIKTKRIAISPYIDKAGINKLLDRVRLKKFPNLPFKLDRLFPGSEADYKHSKKFGPP